MKKLLLLLLIAPVLGYGQLNSNAKLIKENMPTLYETIKKYSESKWDNDYEMIVYTINNQADAFAEISRLMSADDFDQNIWYSSVVKWAENPSKVKEEFSNGNSDIIFTSIIQWDMVLYNYENQIKAKQSY
jgi:hypothetical protein